MLKKILAFVVMLYAAVAFAAVDVNKATAAELDGIKGIGPAISGKIIDERKKGNFKDWGDFIERVKGVGEGNAAKFSSEGLTVGGTAYKTAAAAPAAKATDAKPAAAAPAADTKADAKAKAAADKQAKADEAKARKEAAKKAKADAKMAKADAAKPAASAAMK
jgi:competence protein ComEA